MSLTEAAVLASKEGTGRSGGDADFLLNTYLNYVSCVYITYLKMINVSFS